VTARDPGGWGWPPARPDRGVGASRSGGLKCPKGLGAGGQFLWSSVTENHDLDSAQRVQLEEACRAKDRCDRFAALMVDSHDSKFQAEANATANVMKQLLAALRLPDPKTGKRPQYRGARGAYKPRGKAVSHA
jgi:hypothetical protein